MSHEKSNHTFAGFNSPRFTQIPDQLIDELMVDLSPAELRIVLYIARRTFGFKKESDNISIDQMVHGITTKAGKVLDRGTGLSKRRLLPALNRLIDRNIIKRTRSQHQSGRNLPSLYSLNIKTAPDAKTTGPTHSTIGDNTSPKIGDTKSPMVGDLASPHKKQETTNSSNNSLSNIVTEFYKLTGRDRISTAKRQKGELELKNLLGEGFSIAELEYGTKWLAKQHPDTYCLSRLKHLLDQALAEMKKATKRKQKEVTGKKTVKQQQTATIKDRQKFLKAKGTYDCLTKHERAKYEKQIDYPLNSPIIKRMAITGLIAKQLNDESLSVS